MATHSSVLAWRIPGMGLHRVGHSSSDLEVSSAEELKDIFFFFLVVLFFFFVVNFVIH